MQELQQSPETAGWLTTVLANLGAWLPQIQAFFWKFMPVPLGAVVMVLFDPPKSRRELFTRLTVSYLVGSIFSGVMFDLLHSFSLFAFLDAANRRHVGAVEFFTAGLGWTMLAMFATYQRKLRETPPALPDAVKNIAP
jgi:hypothetical protein